MSQCWRSDTPDSRGGRAGRALRADGLETVRGQERYLPRNGTIVLKFMLNVSKKMQARRFLRRIDDPSRNWKFSAAVSLFQLPKSECRGL